MDGAHFGDVFTSEEVAIRSKLQMMNTTTAVDCFLVVLKRCCAGGSSVLQARLHPAHACGDDEGESDCVCVWWSGNDQCAVVVTGWEADSFRE